MSSPSPATNFVILLSNQVPNESRLGLETVREIHEPDLSICAVPERRSERALSWLRKACVWYGELVLQLLSELAIASQYLEGDLQRETTRP